MKTKDLIYRFIKFTDVQPLWLKYKYTFPIEEPSVYVHSNIHSENKFLLFYNSHSRNETKKCKASFYIIVK